MICQENEFCRKWYPCEKSLQLLNEVKYIWLWLILSCFEYSINPVVKAVHSTLSVIDLKYNMFVILFIPGQNKKFKHMFFVLLGDDKQLCYLENDKVWFDMTCVLTEWQGMFWYNVSFYCTSAVESLFVGCSCEKEIHLELTNSQLCKYCSASLFNNINKSSLHF